MKVLINGRFLMEKQPTGTHRSAAGFTRELLRAEHGLDVYVVCNKRLIHRESATTLNGFASSARLIHTPSGGRISRHLWEQLIWPWTQPDAVHLNLLNTGPFMFPAAKEVMCICDLNFLKLPDVFQWKFRAWNRLACCQAARRSRYIVCITEFVKNDIVNRLNIPPEKITVVYPGSGLEEQEVESAQGMESAELMESSEGMKADSQPERLCNDHPFFLCVGSLQPHKNLHGVIRAWRRCGLAAEGYRLVVVGRKQANFHKLPLEPEELDEPSLEFTGYVSDAALIDLYKRATGFVYPSFHEGFGLPIVEAYQLGCPVITSNCSCLPEVAGSAALLVDPQEPDDIAEKVRSLADDSALRKRLIEQGRQRAKRFTWRQAGQEMAAVLKKIGEE